MKALILAIATSALVAGGAGPTYAQDQHGDQGRGQHQGGEQHRGWGRDQGGGHHWRQGERMGYNDWSGAQPVDYRQHHLRTPPRGYEWRQSNGQYILAAVATGLVASIILNNGR